MKNYPIEHILLFHFCRDYVFYDAIECETTTVFPSEIMYFALNYISTCHLCVVNSWMLSNFFTNYFPNLNTIYFLQKQYLGLYHPIRFCIGSYVNVELAWRSGYVMDCHATAWGSICGRNGVFIKLHVLRKGQ